MSPPLPKVFSRHHQIFSSSPWRSEKEKMSFDEKYELKALALPFFSPSTQCVVKSTKLSSFENESLLHTLCETN